MVDVDGNQYIDYVGSWGPLILGHRHPQVISALENCLASGTSFALLQNLKLNWLK